MDKKALWMMLAQNGSGSGGGSSDNIYPVIITKSGTTYTADKTGQEIYSAIGAGKYVVGIYGSSQITADVKRHYKVNPNGTKRWFGADFSFVTGKTVTQITVETVNTDGELTESVTATTYTLAEDADKIDAPATAGTAGQVLTLDSNLDPVWGDAAGGDGAKIITLTGSGQGYQTTLTKAEVIEIADSKKPVVGYMPTYGVFSSAVQVTKYDTGSFAAEIIMYFFFTNGTTIEVHISAWRSTTTVSCTANTRNIPYALGSANNIQVGDIVKKTANGIEWVPDEGGLPSRESATEGQVLVLDSNLDPVWDAAPGGQFPVSVIYADDGYGNLTISSVDKTYTDISDAINSGHEVILTLVDETNVAGVDIDDPNYDGTGTTTTQIVSTVHTVGYDGVLYLTGLTSLIATTFSIDGNGNAGLYITSLVSGKDVAPLYGYIDTSEGQPTMDITAMDIYDAANLGRKLIVRQTDGSNGFYFYDLDYMSYDDTIDAYTVIMRARIDDRTVRTCTAIYDNANSESTISLTTTRYATA